MATEKFKALVHFIVDECQDQPSRLGATRLNKALWYADVIAYKLNGVSITGDSYVKREKGPVPKFILATLRELVSEGKVAIKEPEYPFDVRKFLSLETAATDTLSHEEIELAREILSIVCGHTATDISDMTHDQVWEAARIGEEIPLHATLAGLEGAITDNVLSWADDRIAEASSKTA